jgi:hypothetical protein
LRLLPAALFVLTLASCAPVEAPRAGIDAQALGPGGAPDLAIAGGETAALYAAVRSDGKGRDAVFCEGLLREPAAPNCTQLNAVAGETRDNGENSPVLRSTPDGTLYATWIAKDPRHELANQVRFTRRPPGGAPWDIPYTLNDDAEPATHDFHIAGVAPDGALYVFWLDRREGPKGEAAPYPSGGIAGPEPLLPDSAALYGAVSHDDGATFEPNFRVAGNICACCRPAVAFLDGRILLAYRSVTAAKVRNIVLVESADRARSWSRPRIVSDDGWTLDACPHSGPALVAARGELVAAWMDGSDGISKVHAARSTGGGASFGKRVRISQPDGTANHPRLLALADALLIALEHSPAGRGSEAVYRISGWDLSFDGHSVFTAPRATRPQAVEAPGGYVAGWAEDGTSRVAFVPFSSRKR